jgi:hypothetical protein
MRAVARYLCAAAALIVILGIARAARADDDFFSSSPGPLSSSHADLDTPDKCNECHTGGRNLSNDKCLGCHDHSDMNARIASGKGFHSSALVKGKQCESCHLEHKGRGYDPMGWSSIRGGQNQFDHKLAGWPLVGKHAAIKCEDCHKKRDKQGLRTYLGNDQLCGSCHEKDQPHGNLRGEMLKCERCHGQSVWKPARKDMEFDHQDPKQASMPLVGSHVDVSCDKCHPKSLFKLKFAKPDFCGNSGCHASPHGGHLFNKTACEACHSPKLGDLKKFNFDHDTRTKFDLGAAHQRMDCYSCHTKAQGERKPSGVCETCHAKDNKHGDRFKAFGTPPKCATCHASTPKWVATIFNHDKQTRFKLTGRHAEIECRQCHRGKDPADFERFDASTVGCMGCHQHKNVHDGQFKDKECLRCHQGAGRIDLTNKSVDTFHGPTSKFPLVKAHKFVKCAQCHKDDNYKDTPAECGARCHEDTLHKGTLGKECSRCHQGGTWEAVRFDHTDDTKWPLKGMHAQLPDCADCHPTREYKGTPTNCGAAGCHQKDDAHKGRLGNKCEQCHRETGDNIFNHNEMSRFKLDGKHLTTKCGDCHPSETFKPRPTNCFGCHPEPAVHKGQYGTDCERCHSTKDFADIKPLHDVGDFSLTGQHDNLPCQRCHRDNRPLAGSGNLCMNCHRQDDVHSNSLSPRCGECHTQFSFAPARFDHTTVGCNLTGLHRALTCYDCHKTGNFGGLSPTCVSCHRDDALLHVAQGGSAAHAGYTTCANCHNPNYWLTNTLPGPATSYGRESVCR